MGQLDTLQKSPPIQLNTKQAGYSPLHLEPLPNNQNVQTHTLTPLKGRPLHHINILIEESLTHMAKHWRGVRVGTFPTPSTPPYIFFHLFFSLTPSFPLNTLSPLPFFLSPLFFSFSSINLHLSMYNAK